MMMTTGTTTRKAEAAPEASLPWKRNTRWSTTTAPVLKRSPAGLTLWTCLPPSRTDIAIKAVVTTAVAATGPSLASPISEVTMTSTLAAEAASSALEAAEAAEVEVASGLWALDQVTMRIL